MNITSIKVMTDYGCSPLWNCGEKNYGEIDLDSLSISINLIDDLLSWAEEYDSTLNQNSPQDSGFKSKEAKLSFNVKGLALAKKLKSELCNVKVYYFDSEKNCVSHI
ncbi:MAG: hypothetical protein QM500_20925 [Methylococcales bacterium]